MKAVLVLADGTIYYGQGFGAGGRGRGEVVFNTSMVGYQELFSNPCYYGQIVLMTYPLIGNYGVSQEAMEHFCPVVSGVVVREISTTPSNWRSEGLLGDHLAEFGVVGIAGIDTRALTRRLRTFGTIEGLISTEPQDVAEPQRLLEELTDANCGRRTDQPVSTLEPYQLAGSGPRLVVIDLGVRQSLLRTLRQLGYDLVVVPAETTREQIQQWQPSGVIISGGPGDPTGYRQTAQTIKELLGRVPVFGIGLGHQVLALAMGARTEKMKFGHRGGNYPVRDLRTNRVYITSQHHGYVVNEKSLVGTDVLVTHRNLNDRTVEGIRHSYLPAVGRQYHPEGLVDAGGKLFFTELNGNFSLT